jgi:ubiquinone/menaquinone biosynthesis C-methylase UbiE
MMNNTFRFIEKGKTMSYKVKISILLILISTLIFPVFTQSANEPGVYSYREAANIVIERLDLKPDSVIVDLGAGDGWWASKIAAQLDADGIIHAAEIEQRLVDAMKTRWANIPQIKPYLCPMDGTGLNTDTCDMAFISKTYHHLDKDKHIDYLKHLKQVIKPSGKLVIIECHPALVRGRAKEHAWLPGLLAKQAEDAGWMLLSCEFITGTDHYMAIFVQPESFADIFRRQRRAAANRDS